MRWAGHVILMREMGNTYRSLVGKREGKRSLGRPTYRWEGSIRMDLKRIHVAQDRDQWWALVNTVMNLRVP
jgi:hypothetical protein